MTRSSSSASSLASLAVTTLSALLFSGGAAAGGYASPWLDAGVDLAPGVQSARVLLADQPLLDAPSSTGARRGSAARDAHLPIFAAKRGPGCQGAWLQVGPLAWVCETAVDASTVAPIEPGRRMVPESFDGMPYRYFFVGRSEAHV